MHVTPEIVMLLLQAANAGYVGRDRGDLSIAELMALRFFAHANEYSRTQWALAEFQGTPRGDAAHVVKGLLAREYLTPSRNGTGEDRGTLMLTELGRAALTPDPCEALAVAVDALADDEKIVLGKALRRLLLNLAEDTAHSYLNSCRSCGMTMSDDRPGSETGAPAPTFTCSLHDTQIHLDEVDRICINFVPSEKAATLNDLDRRTARSLNDAE